MKLIIIDTETTGLNPELNNIIQLAAVDYDDPNSYFNMYSNIVTTMEPEAQQKHGLTPEKLTKLGAVDIIQLLLEFELFINQYDDDILLAGWNPGFDYSFLRCYYKRANLQMHRIQYKTLDVFSLCWLINKNLSSLNDAVAYFIASSRNQNHDALQDALLTRSILYEVITRIDSWKTLFDDVTDCNIL